MRILRVFRAPWTGVLTIKGMDINCAVLDDRANTRVISTSSMVKALGTQKGGSQYKKRQKTQYLSSANLPIYISSPNLIPFISNELKQSLDSSIRYVPTGESPLKPAIGLPATLLPDICEVYFKAKEAGVLTASQL